jgi:predicted ferric reductase
LTYNENVKSLSHPYVIECGVVGSKNTTITQFKIKHLGQFCLS